MGRAPCCDKANVKKGPWSPEEDAKLKHYIESNGTGGNWIALPKKAGLKRCGKSCRLRWLNYLRPDIKHGEFSDYEDNVICTLFATIGSRWSIIAAQLPGRTDNDIKNYWNTKLKKKFMNRMISYNQQRKSSEEYSHHHHQIFSSSINHQSSFQTPSPFATASVYHPSLSFPLTSTTTTFLQTQESFLMQQQQQKYGGEASCSSFEGSYNNQNQGVNYGSILGDYNDVISGGGIEEIKRLIGNGNCSNFLFDENKTDGLDFNESIMYY